jgi:SAM-dependent methyltransferase
VTGRFSFEVVNAVDYDELRPSYAPEAVEWVAERGSLRGGSIVVDLAAGTGQLSRRFADSGVDLVAVEPAANMRAVLEERLPAIRVVDGTAEGLPLPGGSADAVVVGNAFHHFERQTAFAEIHRVLRPGGVLALFWAWPLEEEQLSIPGCGRSTRLSRQRERRTRSLRRIGRGQKSPVPQTGSARSNGVSSR